MLQIRRGKMDNFPFFFCMKSYSVSPSLEPSHISEIIFLFLKALVCHELSLEWSLTSKWLFYIFLKKFYAEVLKIIPELFLLALLL